MAGKSVRVDQFLCIHVRACELSRNMLLLQYSFKGGSALRLSRLHEFYCPDPFQNTNDKCAYLHCAKNQRLISLNDSLVTTRPRIQLLHTCSVCYRLLIQTAYLPLGALLNSEHFWSIDQGGHSSTWCTATRYSTLNLSAKAGFRLLLPRFLKCTPLTSACARSAHRVCWEDYLRCLSFIVTEWMNIQFILY